MHLLALFTYLTIHQTYVVIRYSVTMYASRSFLKSDLHLHTTLPKYSTYSNIQVSSLIRFNVALNALPKLCNVLQNFKLVLDIPLDHNKLLNFNLLQDLATRSYFHICSYMVKFTFSYFLLDNQQICLINKAQSCSNQSYKYRCGAEIGRVQETSPRDISAEHRQKSANLKNTKIFIFFQFFKHLKQQ